jgi:predicted site-specific integrase-resolvase
MNEKLLTTKEVCEAFFSSHGVQIEYLEETLPKSYEAELYGRRSAQNHLVVVDGAG